MLKKQKTKHSHQLTWNLTFRGVFLCKGTGSLSGSMCYGAFWCDSRVVLQGSHSKSTCGVPFSLFRKETTLKKDPLMKIWVWLKTQQEGLRRFWSMFPLTRGSFWYRLLEPRPYRKKQNSFGGPVSDKGVKNTWIQVWPNTQVFRVRSLCFVA